MEVKTKMRCGVTRRKCNQIRKLCPKIERNASLRKVSNILRKKESLRSAEEIAVLASMSDEVKEVKFRIRKRQATIERSKEIEDDELVLRNKCKKLANALKGAKHLVVYTGAGISTAADIPDYRGPNGIWTLLQQGKQIGKHDLTRADPTLTHMALWQLYRQRYLKFVVSQNCDGLHLRSGLPKRVLSEVHGNMYIEMCRECKPNVQYWRLFDTTEKTARFYHKTSRICHKCGGSLVDSIVHFGERGIAQWPLNWSGALYHAAKADVILCLGSSLKVLKKYPWLWAMDRPPKKRPAIFIVNLQWTPKDDVAALKINGKCDEVMKLVMEYLNLDTPKYQRFYDPIFAHTSYLSPKELHTTTQPMLVRSPLVKDSDKKEPAESVEEPKAKTDRGMDIDDPDDDCPLNLLKLKMNVDDLPEDLSVHKLSDCTDRKPIINSNNIKVSQEMCKSEKVVSASNEDLVKVESNKAAVCGDIHNVQMKILHGEGVPIDNKEDVKVKMKTVDFSCTVNVEEREAFTKCEHTDSMQVTKISNVKINAIIKSDSEPMECNNSSNNQSACGVEGISMEILAQEFERVHVEMKTGENEIHKVSILLVNKSKISPMKCDKFQQTDPEIISKECDDALDVKPVKSENKSEIPLLDTGQNKNIQQPLDLKSSSEPKKFTWDSKNGVDNLKTEFVKCEKDDKCSTETAPVTIVNKNIQINENITNLSNGLMKNFLLDNKLGEKNKLTNPLRNFRRLKDVTKNITNIENCQTTKRPDIIVNGSIEPKDSNLEEPLDFSLKQDSNTSLTADDTVQLAKKLLSLPCILKVPKPPLFSVRNGSIRKNPAIINTGEAIDLSFPEATLKSPKIKIPIEGVNGMLNRCIAKKILPATRTINRDSIENISIFKEFYSQSNRNFNRKCQSITRAIIQNTLLVNRGELQYAYSGLHSIINPVPFYVQYDFKSVFNSINLIRFGQKLMLKGKPVAPVLQSANKTICNTVKKTNLKLLARKDTKRKKEPQCDFCQQHYESQTCNFYAAFNSDDRFEKWHNEKLVMCDCCGDSETSEDSEEETSATDNDSRAANSKRDSPEDLDEAKAINNNKCNFDLKSRVQNSVSDNSKSNGDPDNSTQAGWFGKGFRKNRRRKR